MRRIFVVAVLLAALVLGYVAFHHRDQNAGPSREGPNVASQQSAIRSPQTAIPTSASAERSHLADDLNAPTADIHHDLQVVTDVLAAYRSNFPHDGNPWGDNQEITAQLTGKNKLHLALIPRDHPAINAAGQLCDRWGTPFFFHAESGTRMAVRSAGPDRKMWTADDVDLEP